MFRAALIAVLVAAALLAGYLQHSRHIVRETINDNFPYPSAEKTTKEVVSKESRDRVSERQQAYKDNVAKFVAQFTKGEINQYQLDQARANELALLNHAVTAAEHPEGQGCHSEMQPKDDGSRVWDIPKPCDAGYSFTVYRFIPATVPTDAQGLLKAEFLDEDGNVLTAEPQIVPGSFGSKIHHIGDPGSHLWMVVGDANYLHGDNAGKHRVLRVSSE